MMSNKFKTFILNNRSLTTKSVNILPSQTRSSTKYMPIDTRTLSLFFSPPKVFERVMKCFRNTSITNLYNFSDVQVTALEYAFKEVFLRIHQPLLAELKIRHGSDSSRKIVGSFDADIQVSHLDSTAVGIKTYRFKLLNTFNSYGDQTSLEVKLPIKLFYDLYFRYLCDHFNVKPDDKLGRKSIKIHLSKPSKSHMRFYFKSLSQSNLLVSSQRCSSQINNSLIFSINSTFTLDLVD